MSELSKAYAAFQYDVDNPPLDTKGYNYRYVSLPKLQDWVRPLLQKHGLYVLQQCTTEGDHVGVQTTLGHVSGEERDCGTITMQVEAQKGMSMAQCAGSVLTYCRRYALQTVLGVTGDADTDAAKAHRLDDATVTNLEFNIANSGLDVSKILEWAHADHLSELTMPQVKQVLDRCKEST